MKKQSALKILILLSLFAAAPAYAAQSEGSGCGAKASKIDKSASTDEVADATPAPRRQSQAGSANTDSANSVVNILGPTTSGE